MTYVIAGVPFVPFHADESMQLAASRDFGTLVHRGGPWALTTRPPYVFDSEAHLRILNGTIHRHVVGAASAAVGLREADLPPIPGWDWTRDFKANMQAGFFPRFEFLMVGRYASAAFLALAVLPAWWLGWRLWGRAGACLFVVLTILHPVVLLNGRRAMQEGSMIFFGLLALALSVEILSGRRKRVWWVGWGTACGLALASKHLSMVFVAAATAMIVTAWNFLGARETVRRGLLAGLTGATVFLALSPALWDQPWMRIQDLARIRADLVSSIDDTDLHGSFRARLTRLVTMPFSSVPQFFEVADWLDHPVHMQVIALYSRSWLSGAPVTGFVGWGVVILAAWGAFAGIARGSTDDERRVAVAWTAGWGVCALLLLPNPLPFQRYYLPLIPLVAGLAVIGIREAIRMLGPSGSRLPVGS
ncbi:MAG: glycosyltransferase family 39 protein [Terrimicrobiaceae bacterium]|nr:glycosyltransferase family 39 protein [Terrimicrobiaceae bacterium]